MPPRAGEPDSLEPVLRVLGVPTVHDQRGAHPVTAARIRIVLAMLALEPRRITPVERLVEAIWQDESPATARSQVQICVSALRRQLDKLGLPDAIQTCAPGYLLDLEPERIDLHLFELWAADGARAVGQGDLDAGAEQLAAALALWRGPAMSGVQSALVQAAVTGLTERRLAVFEQYVEVQLRRGRAAEMVGRISDLLTEQPMRERLYLLQMKALYWSGRSAEALGVYRQVRELLVEELGVEPGPELRALHEALLREDREHPLLDVGRPRHPQPSQPPPDRQPAERNDLDVEENGFPVPAELVEWPLIGRQAELDRLLAEVQPGRLVLLSGISGAGKTRLAAAAAEALADRFPAGYRYLDASGLDADGLAELVTTALAGSGELRERLAQAPVLLVVDGVSDPAAIGLLSPEPDWPAGVLLTSRLGTGLPRRISQLPLRCFSSEQALEFLTDRLGSDLVQLEMPQALRLIETVGRHPGLLEAYARQVLEQPNLSIADLAAEATGRVSLLTDELVVSLAETCQGLNADARMLLRRLALLPVGVFDSWVAGPLLNRSANRTRPALDELVAAGLVEDLDGSWDISRPVRDLARHLLLAEDDANQVAAAERRLWEELLTLLGSLPRELADRLLPQVVPTGPRPALDAESARGWLVVNSTLLRAAVGRTAALQADDLCWRLGYVIAGLVEDQVLPALAEEIAGLATEAASRADDRRGQAALLLVSARTLAKHGDPGSARTRLKVAQELLADLGDEAAGSEVTLALAELDQALDEPLAAGRGYHRSLAGFRAADDEVGQVLAMLGLLRLCHREEQPTAARRWRRRLLELVATATDDRIDPYVSAALLELPEAVTSDRDEPERTWA